MAYVYGNGMACVWRGAHALRAHNKIMAWRFAGGAHIARMRARMARAYLRCAGMRGDVATRARGGWRAMAWRARVSRHGVIIA